MLKKEKMSDEEEQPEEKPFSVERAKQGKAACKLCKQKCPKDELRIAKLMHNPFGAGKMKAWHHLDCLFAQFLKQRVATKRIDFVDDIDGFEQLNEEDQKTITEKINESRKNVEAKFKIKLDSPKKDVPPAKKISTQTSKQESNKTTELDNKDMQFKQFRRLVSEIANVSSYLDKTEIVSNFFKHGTDGKKFKGNITLWCKLLLPGVVKRVYNLQSKQIVKIMSKIFAANPGEMLEHLRQGDVADTVQEFFEKSDVVKPAKKASLSMTDVDQFLEELTTLTKEEDQINHFKKIIRKCTGNDLTMIIRLVKHDLRMNAGAKHILEGVHPDAYQAYQSSRDLDAIISRCLNLEQSKSDKNKTAVKATICVMTPVLPMLAEACKSVEQAMKKCPKGMYSEIKYDGERVQLHKEGSEFKYYSRSLKPVLPHKVEHFKKYIPQAFKHGKDLILDSEILLIDCKTSKPLPFGTLGKHKKNETSDANVCLFVFDCIYYNGEILTNKPLSYRKKILHENMTEIKNHIMFSEFQTISKPDDLSVMIAKVLKLGLEGLVLKPVESVYEPGKRHWLKVKKDYLFDGAMADSADLIVLGAWYGTGKKGGMMSVFLMGCYDKQRNKFCTVTKVHTGHDDKTLNKLQKELDMVNINCEPTNVPDWLHCTRTMVPDFVAKDPKKQPVWEITGAEFTKHDVHTASGISIRFPRVSKIRDDKDWETATSLEELQLLFKNSKESTDVSLLMKNLTDSSGSSSETINDKKRKNSSPEPDTNDSKKLKTVESNEKKDLSTVASHETEKPKIKSIEIKHPLPNFFSSTNILVDSKVNDLHRDILRYFTAYGGSILNKTNSKEANFVVHLDDVVNARNFELMCPNLARHVTLDWLKDCTASEKILDFEPYCVKWDPNL